MFCYQCEQTAKGTGCNLFGVCGKDPRTAALQDLLVHAAKGISMYAHRAAELNARDPAIDRAVLEFLFATVTNVDFDPERLQWHLLDAAKIRDKAKALYENACAKAGKTAETLAGLAGFSKREREYMRIAGLLHDLGKLAVPREILEKPGKLDKSEFDIIRAHTYHTYRILDTLEDFDTINTWGSFHHERLNGKGYPFHHDGDVLSLGSRIMCVSDVFTAITEDRPYRPGMPQKEVTGVLRSMVKSGSIDGSIVKLLEQNLEEVNGVRHVSQTESREMYKDIIGPREK